MWSLLLAARLATGAENLDELRVAYGEMTGADHRFMIEVDEAAARPELVAKLLVEAVLSLPDGDRMEVVAVGATPSVLLPITSLEDVDRTALATTLEGTVWSSEGPVDVGAAIGLIVDELRNEPPARMQQIYAFGDMCHEPPAGSEWAFEGASGCRQIRGLSRLQDALDLRTKSGLMRAYALILGRADPDGLRATLRTLNGTGKADNSLVQADNVDLRRWMAQRAQRVRDEQLARLVREDADRLALSVEGVSVEGDVATIRMGSGLMHLQLALDHLSSTDESVTFQHRSVRLTPTGDVKLTLKLPEPPLALWPHSRPLRYVGKLTATASLEPRRALGSIGLNAGRGRMSLPYAIDMDQHYGLPWAGTALLVVLSAGFVAGVARLWRARQETASLNAR